MIFSELIEEMDSGALNSEASGVLRDLMQRLNEHAQRCQKAKGEITVKLKFEATSNGRVEIQTDVTSKAPAPPRSRETRWLGDRGSLLAADPRQETLPLKAAPQRPNTLKSVQTPNPQAGE